MFLSHILPLWLWCYSVFQISGNGLSLFYYQAFSMTMANTRAHSKRKHCPLLRKSSLHQHLFFLGKLQLGSLWSASQARQMEAAWSFFSWCLPLPLLITSLPLFLPFKSRQPDLVLTNGIGLGCCHKPYQLLNLWVPTLTPPAHCCSTYRGRQGELGLFSYPGLI